MGTWARMRKDEKNTEKYWERLKRKFVSGSYQWSGAYNSTSVHSPLRKPPQEKEHGAPSKPSLVSLPNKPASSGAIARGKLNENK